MPGGLSMVLLQQKDPLELIVKRMEFIHSSRFPCCSNMTKAVESDLKTNAFRPYIIYLMSNLISIKK